MLNRCQIAQTEAVRKFFRKNGIMSLYERQNIWAQHFLQKNIDHFRVNARARVSSNVGDDANENTQGV